MEEEYKPEETVCDKLKIGDSEVLHGDEARVAEGPHHLREGCGSSKKACQQFGACMELPKSMRYKTGAQTIANAMLRVETLPNEARRICHPHLNSRKDILLRDLRPS